MSVLAPLKVPCTDLRDFPPYQPCAVAALRTCGIRVVTLLSVLLCRAGPAPGAAARCHPARCRPRQGCTQGLQEVSSPRGSSAAAAAGPPAPAVAAAAMQPARQQCGSSSIRGWGRCSRSSGGWGGVPSRLALCQVALWLFRQAYVIMRRGFYRDSERVLVACCRALGLCSSPHQANAVASHVLPALSETQTLCSSDDMVGSDRA
jgi:hypothetical protein